MSSILDQIEAFDIYTLPDNQQKYWKVFKAPTAWLKKTLKENPIIFHRKDLESFLKTATDIESRVMYLKAKQDNKIIKEEEF